ALVGVAIMVQAEISALATGLFAAIISLGTAFCFAGQTVWPRRSRGLEMMPGIALGGLLVFAFVSIFVGLPALPLPKIGLLSLMGLGPRALPLILFAACGKPHALGA